MAERRHPVPGIGELLKIEIGDQGAGTIACLRDHDAPRVDDHGVPVARAVRAVATALRRGEHEGLVLDRSSSQQNLPVVLASRRGECAGHPDGE